MLGYNLIAVLSSTKTAGFDGFGPFWGFSDDDFELMVPTFYLVLDAGLSAWCLYMVALTSKQVEF